MWRLKYTLWDKQYYLKEAEKRLVDSDVYEKDSDYQTLLLAIEKK